MIHHLNDATTSTILDSTSNDIDGTKKADNEPIEATGKIGKGQTFDGSDDKITLAPNATLNFGANDFTIEVWVYMTQWADSINCIFGGTNANAAALVIDSTNHYLRLYKQGVSSGNGIQDAVSLNTWTYIAVTFDNSEATNNLVFTTDNSEHTVSYDIDFSEATNQIGEYQAIANRHPFGIFDETRISNIIRTPTWKKASYETQRDHFVYPSSPSEYGYSIQDAIALAALAFVFTLIAIAFVLLMRKK